MATPKQLVIVESPAKAKTINKYLGRDFVVKPSYGHIRDLPSGGDDDEQPRRAASARARSAAQRARAREAALIRRMGVDPEHGWRATYEIVPGKEEVVEELRAAAAKAERVWLASDLDREGEAIAWHLREVIGGPEERFARVTFSEITREAIREAFAHPGTINMHRVHAQQARRFLDRVVGFRVSPLLWAKVGRGLSAGRVQSVAVRLIVEREREIKAFTPEEYWQLHADLATAAGAVLRAELVRWRGEKFAPRTRADIDAVLPSLQDAVYRVLAVDSKPQRAWPSPPFITSTLQAAASVRLGFSVRKTMTLAQRLYEAGHITYMRTDSVNLSAQAVAMARALIGERFGERYLPEKPPTYRSQEGAQEAHEAIRPTDARRSAEDLALEQDERRLYDLIWRQFIACQMPPAEFDTSTVTIAAAAGELQARGRVLRFDGWQRVLPPLKDESAALPQVAAGEQLRLLRLIPSQHFTKPPPRYSEASLVRELEKRGIGRPSTYATIISTIQERGYVRLEQRRFHAEKLGEIVTDRLVAAFPDLMDYGFTAAMERDLDAIAEARADWKKTLDAFYGPFKRRLAEIERTLEAVQPVPTPLSCPACGRPMAIKYARTGVFLTCSGYSLPPKERCTQTINLLRGEDSVAVKPAEESEEGESQGSEAEAAALHERKRCPRCGTAMDPWLIDERRRLHICGNSPNCHGVVLEEGSFRLKGYEGPTIPCDKCGRPMQLKSGRFGKYFGCSGYPACTNTRKLLKNGQPAPPRMPPVPMPELRCTSADDHFVLRDGGNGLFLSAASYPKVRETRPVAVADLQRHRAELPEKYRYLAEAPAQDPEGRPALVRYARKQGVHYIASELPDGKPSGWSLRWNGSAWTPG
ncbi:MAG: type I DNA topoisomerase [Planctomycetota bacterium]|nr:type I DNA topoisomerase [Planctomycetota bacterium]